jgi:hypothetical protein
MPDVEKVLAMKNEGFSNKEISEKLSTEEEPLTYQAIGKLIKDNTPAETKAVVVKSGIKTMTAEEYGVYSEANGRTKWGGEKGVKVEATIEMLRAYISSGWKPSMLKEMWQMSEKELTQLTWRLAKAELRDREPTVNFKQDFFRF